MSPSSVSLRPVRGALLGLATAALLLAACAGGASDSSAPATACTKAQDGVVTMSAKDIKFDTSCIQVPAGEAFKIEFSNKDSAPHDVTIYDDSSKGTEIFRGDVAQPGSTATYQVPPLAAGEHYFECSIHPAMNGKVIAE